MKDKQICNQCDPPHEIDNFKLSSSQDDHLRNIILAFHELTVEKFHKGAKEHGGDLQDMPPMQLLDEAISECIDQFTYLYTLKQKLERIIKAKDLNG